MQVPLSIPSGDVVDLEAHSPVNPARTGTDLIVSGRLVDVQLTGDDASEYIEVSRKSSLSRSDVVIETL